MEFIIALSLLLIVFCFIVIIVIYNQMLKEQRIQTDHAYYANQLLQKSMLVQKEIFLFQKQMYFQAEKQKKESTNVEKES